tara:strand:- start:1296 stop:1478 length:183 start_codon:yes stop_codon:yes gene_type:complete
VKLILKKRDRMVLKMLKQHYSGLPAPKEHPRDKLVRYSKKQRNGVATSIRQFYESFERVW